MQLIFEDNLGTTYVVFESVVVDLKVSNIALCFYGLQKGNYCHYPCHLKPFDEFLNGELFLHFKTVQRRAYIDVWVCDGTFTLTMVYLS